MAILVTFSCGRCKFECQETVAVSRYDLWQGFTLRRVCPRCHVPNKFHGGDESIVSAITTTTMTNYSMTGWVEPEVNNNFEPPNANFA
jgi:hypothetical protein